MADKSKIEWTDASWTPIRARHRATGRMGWHCVHVSEACRNCYAEVLNKPYGTGLPYKPGHLRDVEIVLDEKKLLEPLRWRRPRMIFVCSMTDLFADFVTDEMIDRVFAVMALAPQHTFQVLTKRPERMRAYVCDANTPRQIARTLLDMFIAGQIPDGKRTITDDTWPLDDEAPDDDPSLMRWPLPNVWLGTSVEDQPTANERVDHLRATPAAIRFVSYEPALGPVDFSAWLKGCLDWIIVGGESGKGARPMHPGWARSVRDQCAEAGTAFFFKQHGEWLHEDQVRDGQHPGKRFFDAEGAPIDDKPPFGPSTGRLWHWWEPDHHASIRIGKARAGRLLDGREHNDMPAVRPAHHGGR